MKRSRIRASLPAVAVVAVVSMARADAPPGQYGLFGSTDQTITDNKTLLVWQRYAPGGMVSFQNAATYCQGLPPDAGHTWRVPSYKELLTLVDENPHVEYENGALVPHAIDPNAFPQTDVQVPYWTSSLYPGNQGSAYYVDFEDGQTGSNSLSTAYHVRCVH